MSELESYYDPENRVTSVTTGQTGCLYTRGPTGNLTSSTELSGRAVNWSFDGIYRLTGEAISGDPSKANGSVSYTLDPVGNRLSDTSTLAGVNSGSFSYNPDDELLSETYDANGNVTAANGNTYQYDSQNELVGMNGGAVRLVYDGDGNRVAKTVNGVTTRYLVDDLNPTGYAQVVEETVNGAPQRTYAYGLQRISENQIVNNTWTPSFYQYDGMGSVRQLTNSAGAVTDTYEYDAFGNEISHTGTTPNEMLYRGEQWDSDLGLYYMRARFYNPVTGRFVSRDPNKGVTTDPKTLHKYLYAEGDPINGVDPTGRDDLIETGNLDGELSTAENKQLEEIGQELDCQFKTDAAVLEDAIAPAGETLVSLIPEGQSCTAKANYKCEVGQIVYRVFGGESPLWGQYWTPEDPRVVFDWFDAAGVGEWNSGENIAVGELVDASGCEAGAAEPGGGLPGRRTPQLKVPNPVESHIRLIRIISTGPPR